MLSIMRACKEADIVKRIVFTFSAGSVNIKERPRPAYDQDNWSHIDFCHRVKMKGWVRREHRGLSSLPLLVDILLVLVKMACFKQSDNNMWMGRVL
ncbi:Dihydroflavonol-4-reductase [Hordeum vulgare]|nr:Dihydroflavonol-4-reductase [Hordeum vulgare]